MITIAILTSFLVTFFVVPSIVNVSKEKNLFDEPNQRRLNTVVIPTMGGIAIFIGFAISFLLFMGKTPPHELRYLFVAILMMLFIGIKDDILVIAPAKKMIVQIVAALILVFLGNFRIEHTYGLFPVEVLHPAVSIPLSGLVILFLINAFNLIDGIDGLAGGLALLIAAILATWFFATGHINSAVMCGAFCGAVLAFLYFNLHGGKNKIFMGDTGSLILGVFLASMAIRFNELNYTINSPFRFDQAPLFVLALMIVPVTDTLRVFTVRLMHGRSPFSPDMNHFHHLLIKRGLSHVQASGFLLGYTIFFVSLSLGAASFSLNLSLTFPLMLVLSFSLVGLVYYFTTRTSVPAYAKNKDSSRVKTIPLHVLRKEPAAAQEKTTGNIPPNPLSASASHLIKIHSPLGHNIKVHANE